MKSEHAPKIGESLEPSLKGDFLFLTGNRIRYTITLTFEGVSAMSTYSIVKKFVSRRSSIEELSFYYDAQDYQSVVVECDGEHSLLKLPELEMLKEYTNLDKRYAFFKRYIIPIVHRLETEGVLLTFSSKAGMTVYTQQADEEQEVILSINLSKKTVFPKPARYAFQVPSVLDSQTGKRWWRVLSPHEQGVRPFQGKMIDRPFQNLVPAKKNTTSSPLPMEALSKTKIQKKCGSFRTKRLQSYGIMSVRS